jgi:N-acyl-phosphatidylethanolamine-hydrolysing phospholipase D
MARRASAPPPGGWNLPAIKTDAEALRSAEHPSSVTWIGHATMLVCLGAATSSSIPSSPSGFAGELCRSEARRAAAIDIAELPQIDLVLISHNHYDHLDANR